MTLIFVNRFFYPDYSATSQLLSDLAFALAAKGECVEVVTSRLLYEGSSESLPDHETVVGVGVHRIWTTRFGRSDLKGRALDYLTFHISVAWHLLRYARRGDVVVAMTDPPLLPVVTAFVCLWRRAIAINWLQDLFPEVAWPHPPRSRLGRLSFIFLRALRDFSLRRAAVNIVIGTRMAEVVAARGAAPSQIQVISNWADGGAITPVDHAENPFRQELDCGDALVIGYSGNLGRVHEIDTILEAMTILERPPTGVARLERKLVWLFVGGGALMPRLRAEVQRRQIQNVLFRPYQKRDVLAQSLSAADVHLVSLRPEFEGLVVPSKFYGIIAAGRPTIFIGGSGGELAKTVSEMVCGYAIAAGDADALANVIGRLVSQPALAASLGEAGRRAFGIHFNREIALAKWTDLLARAASKNAIYLPEGSSTPDL